VALRDHPSALVREHVHWALARHPRRRSGTAGVEGPAGVDGA